MVARRVNMDGLLLLPPRNPTHVPRSPLRTTPASHLCPALQKHHRKISNHRHPSSTTTLPKRLKSATSDAKRRPKKGDNDYIKRPENAFILFRRACCEERQGTPDSNGTDSDAKKPRQADLSKNISQMWKGLLAAERQVWENKAKEKKGHEMMYPDYVYRRQRSKKEQKSSMRGMQRPEASDGSSTVSVLLPTSARRNGRSASASTPPLYQSFANPNIFGGSPSVIDFPLPHAYGQPSRRTLHASNPEDVVDYMPPIASLMPPGSFSPGTSFENSPFLRTMFGQPADLSRLPHLSKFYPKLQDHILGRLTNRDFDGDIHDDFTNADRNRITFLGNRMFEVSILRVNYTTYDLRRDYDTINPNSQSFIMLNSPVTLPGAHPYWYARVLGVFHGTVLYNNQAGETEEHDMDFLSVRWMGDPPGYSEGTKLAKLPQVGFVPEWDPDDAAYEFLDPGLIVRGCHMMPDFVPGRTNELLSTTAKTAARRSGETNDWKTYYVGIFVDRDMVMRYFGGGVGHLQPRASTANADFIEDTDDRSFNRQYDDENSGDDDEDSLGYGDLDSEESNSEGGEDSLRGSEDEHEDTGYAEF